MRIFILIIGSVNALLLMTGIVMNLIAIRHTDLAGAGMGQAYVVVMGLFFFIFVLPSLILAYKNKHLGLALTLLILSILLTFVGMYMG